MTIGLPRVLPHARLSNGERPGMGGTPLGTAGLDVFVLLIADSDTARALQLSDELTSHRVRSMVCTDGAEALLAVGAERPDAVLATASLPTFNGAAITRALTAHTSIPAIVAIGDDDGPAAAEALAAGAAACIAQPYRSNEVLRILRAIRPDQIAEVRPAIERGGLRLDPAALEVHLNGRPIRMPLREMSLLQYLMANAGRVVTRDEIREGVWGGVGESNTVTVHIQRLRTRLGDDLVNPKIILTVRGVGYRLIPPPADSRKGAQPRS